MDKKETEFTYSYSAERQKEIDRIVAKYSDDTENKYHQLMKLDEGVEAYATAAAIVYAIVSVLVFGTGMSLTLAFNLVVPGAIVGLFGIVMLFFITKVRQFALKKRRIKVKPKIMEIVNDISDPTIKK